MSDYTPWPVARFNKYNVQENLVPDEICPGTSLTDHAESLAMFELRNSPYNITDWSNLVWAHTAEYKGRLVQAYFGDEQLVNELKEES